MRRLLILFILLLPIQYTAASEFDAAMKIWAEVLQKHVDDQGRTDFIGLSQDSSKLRQVTEYFASNGPNSTPQDFPSVESKLAYHINAYNALAMQGIIDRDIPANFSSFLKRLRFFRLNKVVVDGDETNLYDYENKVIRPLDEPRIHFALNCMVRDCPRLPREPFLTATLDTQLDMVSKEFFNKRKHLYVETDAKTAYVSEILKFYTKDFVASGKAQELHDYINQYADSPVPTDYRIKFIDYDWTVNQSPR